MEFWHPIPAGIPAAAAGIPVRWHPLSDFKTVDSNKRGSRFPLMWLESLQSHEWKFWAPLDSNEEKFLSDVTGIHWSKMRRKKCFSDQMSCFRKEPSDQNIVFLCCCSSEFLSEIFFICYRIRICWKIFLSDKLALTDGCPWRTLLAACCYPSRSRLASLAWLGGLSSTAGRFSQVFLHNVNVKKCTSCELALLLGLPSVWYFL